MAIQFVPKADMLEQVGRKFEPSPWVIVDQERINQFADCTGDHQFIHVDEARAAQTPFGSTIAHGFLTLSLLSHMCAEIGVQPEGLQMGLNYGLNKIRFLAPVRAGKRVRAHVEILEVDQKAENRFLVTQKITVEIEGEDTPALIAEWLGMSITD